MDTRKVKHGLTWMVLIIGLTLGLLFETALAENKPKTKPKAEILQPKPNQILTGNIDTQLKLPEQLKGPVYAGLGGAPWAKLEHIKDSNEWRGQLDSRMVPNGNQMLLIKLLRKSTTKA